MGIPDFQKFDTSIRIIHGSCVFIYLFFTKEAGRCGPNTRPAIVVSAPI
jgi:hypothetical protein